MAKEDKAVTVSEIKGKLSKASGIILTDYRGLDVPALARLRGRLREEGVEYRIFKNTLIRLAAQQLDLSGLDPYLVGPTALVLGYDETLVPARLVAEVARQFKTLKVKAGYFEGKVFEAGGVERLARLPSREVLLASLAANMQGPLVRLAGSLNAPLQRLTALLNGVAQQKAS